MTLRAEASSVACAQVLAWLTALVIASGACAPTWAQTPAAEAESARTALVPQLRIEAPDPLKALLEQYLDLARAIALPDANTIGDGEWSRLIAGMPAQAHTLLQPRGYFAARATVERQPGPPPQVVLRVDPGPQAKVSRVSLEVQGALAERAEQGDGGAQQLRDALMARWPLKAKDPFSNKAWDEAKTALLGQLRAQAYASASWVGTAAEVDTANQGVRLVVVVDSGPLYQAGPIDVEGLKFQERAGVQALAPFAPGQALTEARLSDYQDRLLKAGLFDQVSVSLDGDPAHAEAAHVLVQLRESPRQAATLALGVSANTGPRATVEHVNRRLLGEPLTLRNKLVYGLGEQSWDGELSTHPDADYRRWIVGGTVDRLLTGSDLVLSERLRLGRSKDARGVERYLYGELERARECADINHVTSDCALLAAESFNQHITWRLLDNAVLPTSGYTVQWQVGGGLAQGSQTSNGIFGRFYARATGYWPLGASWYSQARLEGGVVKTSPSGVQVPDSQRFRAGGDDSVRGYAYRTLAPVRADGSLTGGRLLATASAEIARPVSADLPSVWWAAFVDAGRAADHLVDLKPAWGYGVGARWRSPVGPLRLDVAWGQEVHRLRLHLSVGIAF